MWLEETISPSISSSGCTTVSKRASAASSSRSPCALWPKRKFSPIDTCAGAERADEHVVDELLPPSAAANSASNGITISSCTPSEAISSALRVERRQQLRRVLRARPPTPGGDRT